MMKQLMYVRKYILLTGLLTVSFVSNAQTFKLTKLELNYPNPAIPYYYLKADIDLPVISMIEAELSVNGKTLRYTELLPEHGPGDLTHPHLTNTPPSGSGLSQDNFLYKNPSIIGWVKWEPGKQYDVKISVRMKKTLQHSKNDIIL